MLNYCVLDRNLCDSFYSMHLEPRRQETRLAAVAEAVQVGRNLEMENHSYTVIHWKEKLRSTFIKFISSTLASNTTATENKNYQFPDSAKTNDQHDSFTDKSRPSILAVCGDHLRSDYVESNERSTQSMSAAAIFGFSLVVVHSLQKLVCVCACVFENNQICQGATGEHQASQHAVHGH